MLTLMTLAYGQPLTEAAAPVLRTNDEWKGVDCKVTIITTLRLRQNGHHFAYDISVVLSWMKIIVFWLFILRRFISQGPVSI